MIEVAAGARPEWVKAGVGLKVKNGPGKVLSMTDTTVTFNSQKASSLKVGEEVSVEKGRAAPAGC